MNFYWSSSRSYAFIWVLDIAYCLDLPIFLAISYKDNFSKHYCYVVTQGREYYALNSVKAFHCSQWALIKRRERIFVVDRSISLFLPFIHHLFFLCSILLIQKHFSWIPPSNVLTVKEKCLRFWAWAQHIEWPFT